MKCAKRMLAVLLALILMIPAVPFGLAEGLTGPAADEAAPADVPTEDGDAPGAANPDPDDDAEIAASPAEAEVPEAGELSLDDLGDAPGDDPGALEPETPPQPEAGVITYCFIVEDALYATQTAQDGEEIARPEDPAAPEGMRFAGWALEDGTPVFIDDAPLIARADPLTPEIYVLAVFIEAQAPADDTAEDADTPVGTPLGASADAADADPADDAQKPSPSGEGGSASALTDEVVTPDDDTSATNEEETTSSVSPDGEPASPEGEAFEAAQPFSQSALCDGVIITVEAAPGVFPAGALLSVTKVLLDDQGAAEAAVDEVRPEDRNVAARYTFDIKVLDAEGVEVQPVEGRTVQVSFAMAEVADENLETDVYHIDDDMTAEKLDVTAVDAATAVVETEGFSLYTVEFTYNTLQYVLEGGGSVPLVEITTEVGLQGEPTPVSVSDERLFCAAYEDGAWVIYSLRPFRTEEWMQVEIGGTAFTITVTDATDPVTYVDENGNTQTRNDVSFVSAGGTSWSTG